MQSLGLDIYINSGTTTIENTINDSISKKSSLVNLKNLGGQHFPKK